MPHPAYEYVWDEVRREKEEFALGHLGKLLICGAMCLALTMLVPIDHS